MFLTNFGDGITPKHSRWMRWVQMSGGRLKFIRMAGHAERFLLLKILFCTLITHKQPL